MNTSTTDIWLRVMVPVLSRQTVWTDPRVSTACRCRMRTWCCRMSRTPKAMVVVATMGRPSGTAAAARQMEVLSICTNPMPQKEPTIKVKPQMPMHITTNWSPS